jgi:hypothetical protein
MPEPDPINPYASPEPFRAIETNPTGPTSPQYRLYSKGEIVLATFLGSYLAGGILMAIDYRRLERSSTAWLCLTSAVIGQLVLFVVIEVLPDNIPSMMFLGSQLLLMYVIADRALGSALQAHYRAGGRDESTWKAVGIGLACCLLYMIIAAVIVFVLMRVEGVSFDEL